MHTPNAKQEALDVIQRLPDNVDLDEIVYRLYVLDAIHKGLNEPLPEQIGAMHFIYCAYELTSAPQR